jgi:hypothetical protein
LNEPRYSWLKGDIEEAAILWMTITIRCKRLWKIPIICASGKLEVTQKQMLTSPQVDENTVLLEDHVCFISLAFF